MMRVLVACAVSLAAFPQAAAQQRPVPADSGVVFDFQDADLRVVLNALAEAAGLSIVYGDLPSRSVTLRTNRPVRAAEISRLLESLARANGLELVEDGGLLRVAAAPPPEPAPAEPAPSRAGPRRLFVHRLRHARAETVAQTLSTLYGIGGGSVAAASADRSIPLSEALRAQQVAPYQPPAPEVPAMPPAAAVPGAAAGTGLATGLNGAVDLVPDAPNNAILILASTEDYEILRAAIDELDGRPLQVLIEGLIAEVRRDRSFALGIDARVPLKAGGDTSALFTLQGASAGDVALKILGIGSVGADLALRALAASGDVTIISRPVILAQNNQEARILVGDQRPFIQLFRALPTDDAVRDQVVQYRNVGTQLTIRPTINPDGYVTLSVLQEVSSATTESQFGAPVINTREAETQLLVKEGHTAVIGGLISHQRESGNSGIPLLKDLPILGALFRSSQKRTTTSELFLFLTPHVLRTDDDLESVTRDVREEARQLKRELPDTLRLLPRRDSVPPRDSIPR